MTDVFIKGETGKWTPRGGNMETCLVVFMVAKRHHDHSNSYKGKHFIEAGLQIQRFSPLSSWWEAWEHAGRHGAGE